MGFRFRVLTFLAVAAATVLTTSARADDSWKDAAMTALFANAEIVLEARRLVKDGSPIFGPIEHRKLHVDPRSPSDLPTDIEVFAFELVASFGDAYRSVGKLTITQTTKRHPRAPIITYTTKLEAYPIQRF